MKKNLQKNGFMTLMLMFAIMANAANINVTGDVTVNTLWTNNNIYILYGDILVKSGATLTIEPGTIIKGDKATTSRLVVTTSGKLIAQGTPEQPIVFTSNQPAGQRSRGDWAGVAVCGKAPVNFKDAGGNPVQGRIECGTTTDYDFGGSNPDDSSGVISYVRIEYAGFVCGSNTELNSLTLGGVGRQTKIDHVQITYGQDDGFEWFGGTANASHLISFGSRDDDFDTDNGFSGKVQYGLIIRVDTIADQGDISNGFESDNDANGTFNAPYTSATFSNITVVGPAPTTTSTIDPKYGWAFRLRRNTALNVFNSLVIGYKRGLRIEGTSTQLKATNDTLEFKYNIIAGSKEQAHETAFDSLYLANPANGNNVYGGNANAIINLGSPYGNPDNFNFLPQSGSPALSGANFANAKLNGFEQTTFRGAFGTENWTTCWAEYSPNNEDYTTSINYGFNASIQASGTTVICQGESVDLTASTNASGATYLWSNNASTPVITVTTAGTYTVTVTSARGCTRVVSQNVVVNPNPATPVISASANAICTGQTPAVLTAPSAASWSWSQGGSTQSINVTLGGSYSVTVVDANNCSASSDPVTIVQNNPIVPVVVATGPTSFCTGDSIQITVLSQNNFTLYNWSNNSANDTITVFATGDYSVTSTDINNCTAVSNTITTNVSNAPTPTISANGSVNFCSGDSLIISSTPGESYLWSTFETTQSIVVKQSGAYSVQVVNNANACLGVGVSNVVNVNVTTTPTASFTKAAQGSSYAIQFTSTSQNATTYAWDFGNGQTSGQTNPLHEYTQDGTYTVKLTAFNGFCSDETTQTVTIVGVGVNDMPATIEALRLYPNPNHGQATLEVTTVKTADATITVFDLTGRVMTHINTLLNAGDNRIELSTADMPSGLYVIAVKNGAESRVVRMTVNQ